MIKKKKTVQIMCALLIAAVLICFTPQLISNHRSVDIGRLDDWYYFDEDGKRTDITLPYKLYQNDGGVIEIYTVLPESFNKAQTIAFWTYYQCVEVFLDGEQIYYYNNSLTDSFTEASTSQWNYVDVLSGNAAGKTLKIKLHTPYKDINIRMAQIVFGSSNELNVWIYKTFNTYRLLELIFIVIGSIVIAFAFFQHIDKQNKQYLLYAGIFFVLFSTYLRTGTKGLPIYWFSNYTKEFLCYFSLLFLSVPFTLYIKARVIHNKKMVQWCNCLAVAEIIAGSMIFILHATGLKDIHTSMGIGIFLLVVSAVTAIVFDVYYLIKERSVGTIASFFSAVVILFVIAAESVQFYELSSLPFETGFLSHLGGVIVVVLETTVQALRLRKDIVSKKQVAEENKNLQLQLLTSQIKPHFLLNTVGAIRTLIREDPDRASDLLYEFSKYFRKNLEQKDYTKPIPFPEELDYISTYLKLERARFGDRINIEYDIETREFWVLPLTVQPFVENAVKHGLFPAKYDGILKISTRKLKDATLITIEDNGVGFDVDELEHKLEEKKSVGMRSAMMRLNRELNGTVTVNSSMKPGSSGSVIQIILPDKRGKKNENYNS